MYSYVTMAQRMAAHHPARPVRALVNRALEPTDGELEQLYSPTGRPSMAAERLRGTALPMVLYAVRWERQLEGFYRLLVAGYNLLRMRKPMAVSLVAG